jgi:hypothetical protein
MTVVERFKRHRVAVTLVGAALAGGAAGALVPPPRAGADTTDSATWRLPPPSAAVPVTDAEFDLVRSASIFGAPAAAGKSGVKAPSWRLTAIITRPAPVALVAVDGSRQVLSLRAGDSLPDGGVVTAVAANGLVYSRQGCSFERRLYTASETPLGDACAASASAPAQAPPKTPRK